LICLRKFTVDHPPKVLTIPGKGENAERNTDERDGPLQVATQLGMEFSTTTC